MNDKISKLPLWAQRHIEALEKRALQAEVDLHDEPTPERDLPAPSCGEAGMRLTKGWDFNSFRGIGGGVYKACSSCIYNGEGWERTSSQGKRNLFSTELKATQAMRSDMVLKHRQNIAVLDKRITALKTSTASA